MLRKQDLQAVVGDFEEAFHEMCGEKGFFLAVLWYWGHMLRSVPSFIVNFFYWGCVMFRNYLKIALRNIGKHKGYSLINITGLAMGMACCIVILAFVQREFSYDRFHKNADRIYRLCHILKLPVGEKGYATCRASIPPMLAEEFPEIESYVRIKQHRGTITNYKDNRLNINPVFADPSIFKVFTFPLIDVDPETALSEPYSVVITKELAIKYFGDENPIGKFITVDNKLDFQVTGLLQKIPENSHFQFEFLASLESLRGIYPEQMIQRGLLFHNAYFLFTAPSTAREFAAKLSDFVKERFGEQISARRRYFLQPLTSIHLHSDLALELAKNSNVRYSIYLSVLAATIMIIACINFMNLSSARAIVRVKEVGIRKVVGAQRFQLVKQLLSESMLMTVLSLVLAVGFSYFLFPLFNDLMRQNVQFSFLGQPQIMIGLVIITITVGMTSGSYPALFLSAFRPALVLKGMIKSNLPMIILRKALVVFQFTLSVVFIISALVVIKQLVYIRNRDLGFQKENLINISIFKDRTTRDRVELFKTELLKHTNILSAAGCAATPGRDMVYSYAQPEGFTEDEKLEIPIISIDQDFLRTLDIELIVGRNVSPEYSTDEGSAVIINEVAVRRFGWKEPLGKRINLLGYETDAVVVGVVRDFHLESLRREIGPCIFIFDPGKSWQVVVRIAGHDIPATVEYIKKRWHEFSPNYTFWYDFLDQSIEGSYAEEKRFGKVLRFASVFAVLIACLGLFGLSTFDTERRIKEVGIRKVLGASVSGMALLLSKDFIRLVLVANILAWPVAYYFMNKWLQNFAYRFHFTIWIPLSAAFLSLVIAVLTVNFQAIKAARANPVDSLRYE